MRTLALALLCLALSPTVFAGPINDHFVAGVGGVSWGMNLDDVIGLRPGGDQYFSTSPGGRGYMVLDDDPLFGIPRPGMRVQYHFGEKNEVRSIAICVPYARREELLGALLVQFGRYEGPVALGTADYYIWRDDERMALTVKASREPKNGILEIWLQRKAAAD